MGTKLEFKKLVEATFFLMQDRYEQYCVNKPKSECVVKVIWLFRINLKEDKNIMVWVEGTLYVKDL